MPLRALQRPISKPAINIDQPRLAKIAARTRITPVLRQIHIAPLDRIAVDVVELLPHNRLAEDHFGMASLLPELILPIQLVRLPGETQPRQKTLRLSRFQQLDEAGRSPGLDLATFFWTPTSLSGPTVLKVPG